MHNIKQHGSLNLRTHQGGAVLIVSMVILLIMTLIGTANMQSSGFQQKMATNAKARQEAFQLAESTLRFAETRFQASYSGPVSERALILNCNFGNPTCFESSCRGGLCFAGRLDPALDRSQCQILPTTTAAQTSSSYLNKTIWENDDFHMKATNLLNGVSGNYVSDPKYIIEFMCYVKKDESQDCKVTNGSGCSPLFRVTALVERQGAAARVMLSSVFRVNR